MAPRTGQWAGHNNHDAGGGGWGEQVIDMLCTETSSLIDEQSKIQVLAGVHYKLGKTLQDVENIMALPAEAAAAEEMLRDDNQLLQVHPPRPLPTPAVSIRMHALLQGSVTTLLLQDPYPYPCPAARCVSVSNPLLQDPYPYPCSAARSVSIYVSARSTSISSAPSWLDHVPSMPVAKYTGNLCAGVTTPWAFVPAGRSVLVS